MKKHLDQSDTKSKIRDAAKSLFGTKGFQATTVREIVKNAGVTTGSLYHCFNSKEAILSDIISNFLSLVLEQSVSLRPKSHHKCSEFFIEMQLTACVVEESEHIRELLGAAFNSPIVSDFVMNVRSSNLADWFSDFNEDFSHSDYYNRAIVIKGILQSLIAHKIAKPDATLHEQLELLYDTTKTILNIPENTYKKTIKMLSALQTQQLVEKLVLEL